ncbi:MAG: rhomboid family intramembrane serine protease [Bacteroidales bacterium]|nr:rhomboid family intramembrane serine protease [Bacteroidales bacterium]
MTTYLIIGFTSLISYQAFKNKELFNKFMFNAYMVYHKRDFKRLISHGFLHADWTHLIFNMLTLFFFGDHVENTLIAYYGSMGSVFYLILYLTAIPLASLMSLFKHKDMHSYNSVGASGAVSAVLFAAIMFNPTMKIMLIILPIPMPAWVFGLAYLGYSHYMSKQNSDNINHDAHFIGSIYGLLFPALLNINFAVMFVNQLFG